VKRVDVVRNNAYLHAIVPGAPPVERDVSLAYVDTAPVAGEAYYYMRVEQVDGQLAWSSPVWITYRK
jgi:hypothetical protein